MRYTAFISYRRTERDLAVAKEIQQSLERFRVPAAIRRTGGKDGIGRIFRDQSEMEITSDLSAQLMEALEESEYLIVICSEKYQESPWCMQELETFVKMRGREKVLCVLSEGDPPGVFPSLLTENGAEPLACDYRGKFREAGRTELPRLAAVLLGCSYDELIRRQERWRRQRLAAILTAASAFAVLAISYLLWSNARITKNYRQARINESKLLASQSLEAFGTGDRLTALEAALEALTGEDPARPVTDEGQYALSQASCAYFCPGGGRLLERWRVDPVGEIRFWFLSADGQRLVCGDDEGVVRTYALETGDLLGSFPVDAPFAPCEGRDGELVFFNGMDVFALDGNCGEERWRMPLFESRTGPQTVGGIYRETGSGRIAVNTGFSVPVMRSDGTPEALLLLPEMEGWYMTELCWNPDGTQIAAILMHADPEKTQYRAGFFDTESGAFRLLEPVFGHVSSFCFGTDGTLYLLGDNRADSSAAYGRETHLAGIPYVVMAFRGGELSWQQLIPVTTLRETVTMRPEDGRLVLALGSTVYVYDADGALTAWMDVGRDIFTLTDWNEHGFSFVAADGELGTAVMDTWQCDLRQMFPEDLDACVQAGGRAVVSVSGNLCVYEEIWDETLRFFEGSPFETLPDHLLRDGDRVMVLDDRTLRFYSLERRKETASFSFSDDMAVHPLCAEDGKAWLLGVSGSCTLFAVDMETGAVVREDALPVREYYSSSGVLTPPFSRAEALSIDFSLNPASPAALCGGVLWLNSADGRLVSYRLSDGAMTEIELDLRYIENGFPLPSPIAVSPDGRYLLTGRGSEALLVSAEDGSITPLPGVPGDLRCLDFTEDGPVFSGPEALFLCTWDGQLQYSIPYAGDAPLAFAVHGGKVFCVFPDGRLRIYEGGAEIRNLPLSFDLAAFEVFSGRAFRWEFTPDRLYLFLGNELNVVSLSGEGTTAVYYADGVLAHLDDRHELLVSVGRQLGSFTEYSVEELVRRGEAQAAQFLAES